MKHNDSIHTLTESLVIIYCNWALNKPLVNWLTVWDLAAFHQFQMARTFFFFFNFDYASSITYLRFNSDLKQRKPLEFSQSQFQTCIARKGWLAIVTILFNQIFFGPGKRQEASMAWIDKPVKKFRRKRKVG